MRNAVISGLALGSVIVEASPKSGTRTLARLSLAQGRPVFLWESLLDQQWARALAQRPGAYVVNTPEQVTATVERLTAPGTLVA
jgi:DNA processing protein